MGIQVSTLPSIYFGDTLIIPFDKDNFLGWNGMVDRFMAIYEVLFDASSSVPVESRSKS